MYITYKIKVYFFRCPTKKDLASGSICNTRGSVFDTLMAKKFYQLTPTHK